MAWKNVQYENGKYKTSNGGGGGSSTFADLDDVVFSNLQNGQVPKYNSTTQKWENANESGGGGTVTDVTVDGTSVVNQQGVAEITMPTPPSELSDLSDVQFSNLTDHQPLRYNATSQKWVNGADNYPPLIYSDEEREVGVWTDGKPLYEVTKIYNNLHIRGVEQLLDSGLLSVDSFVEATGSWVRSDGTCDNLPSSHTNGNFCVTANDFDKTTGKINLVVGSFNNYFYLESCVITFRYTKTTDNPGSGIWTTSGVPTHHYSTTEQVVGTWIDGKPLYEKTLKIINNIDFSTGVEIATGISNPEFVKIVEGYFYDSPNDGIGALPYNQGVSSLGDWIYLPVYKQSTNKLVLKTTATFSANNARYLVIVLQYTKTTD